MRRIIFTVLTIGLMSFVFACGKYEGGHELEQGSNNHNVHWMTPEKESKRVNPIKRDNNSITRGVTLSKKNCASCHGAEVRGNGPAGKALNPKPTDLKQMSGNHPDGDFAWKIKIGRGAMPAWKSILSENQIWDLVNYIQSLSATKRHEEENKHQTGRTH
jgi:mono/diheme cytochrome c family protein